MLLTGTNCVLQWAERGPYHHYEVLGSHSFESSGSAGRENAGRGRPKKELIDSEIVLSLSNWRFVRDALQEGLSEFKPVTVQDIDVSIKMSCSLYRNPERQSEWPYFDKHGLTIGFTALMSLISDPQFHKSLLTPLKEKYEEDVRRPVLPTFGADSRRTDMALTNIPFVITAGAQARPLDSPDEGDRWTGRSRADGRSADLSEQAANTNQSKKRQAKDDKTKGLSQGKKTAARGKKTSQTKNKRVARSLLSDLDQVGVAKTADKANKVVDDNEEDYEDVEDEALPNEMICDGLRVVTVLTPTVQLFTSDSELSDSEKDSEKRKKRWTEETSHSNGDKFFNPDLSATPPEQTGSNYKGSLNPKDCPGGPIVAYDATAGSPVKKKKTRGRN